MPRPLPVPLRQEIVRRCQQGTPLTRIAADLAIPYGTVRNIWRLFRRHGGEGLAPNYRSCGRPVPPRIQDLLHLACELKRRASKQQARGDFRKLDDLCEKLDYPAVAFINVDSLNTHSGVYEGKHPERFHFFAVQLRGDEPYVVHQRA